MMKRLLYIIAAVTTAAFVLSAGCSKDQRTVLASIGDRSITLDFFKHRLSKLPAYFQEIIQKDRKKFLNDIIVEELFYEEAMKRGLDRDKDTRDVIQEATKKILMARLIKDEVEDKINVTEKMMKDYYDEHRAEFVSPPVWRASHILVRNEEEAKAVLDELSRGADFAELAKAKSIDNTASRGGDIGYFTYRQVIAEFEAASLKLDVGQVSEPVKSQYGYHIIKLTEKLPPQTESFENMQGLINTELQKAQRKESFNRLVATLKERYKVRVNEENLKKYLEEKPADVPKDENPPEPIE